ncbi:hypothetical protein JCM10207_007866 [Rhodosporidiobolus poonsookiae]
MSRPWDIWLTPTLTLSLILEAESPTPTFSRWFAGWYLWFRPLVLREALQHELDVRGGAAGLQDTAVVSAGTLRVVDYAQHRLALEGGNAYRLAVPDSLGMSIANAEAIDVPSLEYDLLTVALSRVVYSYALVDAVTALAETPYPENGADGADEAVGLLKELWERLRPEKEYPGLVGKHWQELGFQNVSPSTDFRGVGMLGLRALLYFARTYGGRAADIVDESVGGGPRWYPLALASLHMTAFALDLAKSRDLQLFLLRHLQTPPSSDTPAPASSELASASLIDLSSDAPPSTSHSASAADTAPTSSSATTADAAVDIDPFLSLSSDLLLLFHSHWQQGDYTVMQFEQTSRAFQAALRPWIRRGVLDGRALGWESWDEGGVKLD